MISTFFLPLQFPINAILPVITALTYFGFSAKISYHRRKLAMIEPSPPAGEPSSGSVQTPTTPTPPEGNTSTSNPNVSLMSQKSTLLWTFELINPLQHMGNISNPFDHFSLTRASVTFTAVVFLAMTIMLESILWENVSNDMTPTEIMDDPFSKYNVIDLDIWI